MKIPEKFLHLVWNHLLFEQKNLQTVYNEPIKIIHKGKYNYGQGPDFKEALIQIGDFLWNGSIEIEVHAKNWYEHQHHKNLEFNNVILLVCYENIPNQKIINSNGWEVPVLVLKHFIDKQVIYKLEILLQNEIPCKPYIRQFPIVLQKNLLTQKAIERLENKVLLFKNLDLEIMSWRLLWRAFGTPYHSELFLEISEKINPNIFFECSELLQKEALVLGTAGFLNGNFHDEYFQQLKEEWNYLKIKFQLQEVLPQFINFKTRFHNFPNILLSQLVAWFHEHGNSLLNPKLEFFENFGETSIYWKNHTFFDKPSKIKMGIGKQKILKLLVNWYFPYRWYHANIYQPEEVTQVLNEYMDLEKEENSITKKMEKWGWKIENGLEAQGSIQLYKKYCLEKKCLECNLGQWILKNENQTIALNLS